MKTVTFAKAMAFGLLLAAVPGISMARSVVYEGYNKGDVYVGYDPNAIVVEDVYIGESPANSRIRLWNHQDRDYQTRWERANEDINTDGFSLEGIPSTHYRTRDQINQQ